MVDRENRYSTGCPGPHTYACPQSKFLMSFHRMEVYSAPVSTSRVRRAQGLCTEVHICNPSRLKIECYEYGAILG